MRKDLSLDKFKLENMTMIDDLRDTVGASLSLSTHVFSGAENTVKESRRCLMLDVACYSLVLFGML